MCKRERLILISVFVILAVAMGSSAMAQGPTKAGLVFWLDASKTGSLVLSGDKVTRWNDLSGNEAYADQTAAAVQPTYVRGALNGRGVVDFGDSAYENTADQKQPWMQMRDASDAALNISNVRTVFWVCGMDTGAAGFLLGDDNNYHFHRGQQQQMWDGANGWAHANIRDGSTYLNGTEVDGTATVVPTDYSIISLVTAGNVETSWLARDRTYRSGGIKLGELLIYDRALTDAERISVENYLYNKWFVPGAASDPQPGDGAEDVLRDPMLSWTAGEFAATHDVYFGTAFSDVNDASTANPMNVLLGEGQAEATFDPGRLEYGQVYYWRVDEVNAPPSDAIFKGDVWSFTVEKYAHPITTVIATASSSQVGMGPENTVNGSGLDGSDQHSAEPEEMWLSGGVLPNWIQFEFDKVYMLHELHAWNSNQLIEPYIGFGAKDVTVEYSADGVTWMTLDGVPEFAQGTGMPTYTANTTVDLGGVMARYVKLTIDQNWGVAPQAGLSEVRFMAVPVSAEEPEPASGAADVPLDAMLSWRAGRQAASHEVFLGIDANDLPLAATVSIPRYAADLNLGATYYWKVVEVNEAEDPAAWEGDLWSFSTVASLTVDDFESYTDDMDTGGAIFQTWIDGYEVPDNGSIVGYGQAPFAERTIVQGGSQAMPLFYDNSAGAAYSEAVRTLDAPQDWNKHGVRGLSLYFHGDPNNSGQMYLKINGTKVPYGGKADDIKRPQWQPWNIDLAATGASLGSVTELALGVEDAGATGTLYFDDIRLYPSPGDFITPVDPGTTGLLAHYPFDSDLRDAVGANHGTAVGDAKTGSDPVRGQVLLLDGIGDAVAVPPLGSGNTLTIAMWVNTAVDPLPIQFASTFHADGWTAGDLHWRYSYGKVNAGINGVAGGDLDGKSIVKANQWNHVAITVSPTEMALWLNGLKEASRTLTEPVAVTFGEGLIGAWIGTDGVTISRAFTGEVDDARFYDRALSQEELAYLADRTEPFYKPF